MGDTRNLPLIYYTFYGTYAYKNDAIFVIHKPMLLISRSITHNMGYIIPF